MLTDPFLPGADPPWSPCSPITTLRRADEGFFYTFYIFHTCCIKRIIYPYLPPTGLFWVTKLFFF